MNIHDFIEKLEPQQATTADASPIEDLQLMSVTSAAISLKRIADALWGTEGTTGLVQLLNGIEMNGRMQ